MLHDRHQQLNELDHVHLASGVAPFPLDQHQLLLLNLVHDVLRVSLTINLVLVLHHMLQYRLNHVTYIRLVHMR